MASPSQATAITLQNNGNEAISLQMRVFEWSQADGQDQLTPTHRGRGASPPVAKIAPGSSYTARIARTAGAVAAGFRSKLIACGSTSCLRRPNGGTKARKSPCACADLPVFFHGADTSPKLSWNARKADGALVLDATIRARATLASKASSCAKATTWSRSATGSNGYVLANSTRCWTAPAGSAAALEGGSATVVTGIGDDEEPPGHRARRLGEEVPGEGFWSRAS